MTVRESIIQEEAPASIGARRSARDAEKIVASATMPSGTLAEKITDEELAELRGLQQAVTEGQQRIAQIQESTTKVMGAFEYVVSRLSSRYGLTAKDEVGEDGTIRRAASPDVPAT